MSLHTMMEEVLNITLLANVRLSRERGIWSVAIETPYGVQIHAGLKTLTDCFTVIQSNLAEQRATALDNSLSQLMHFDQPKGTS